jgi:hypothetical protein
MRSLAAIVALSLLCAGAASHAAAPAPAQPGAAAQAGVKPADATPPEVQSAAAKPADAKTPDSAVPTAVNRVELDTTQITGNRELPRVLYVVPWKRADLGEVPGKPAKSLLDEVLAPVDRDVFRRQNRYHDALQPDTAAPGKAGAVEGER